MDVKLRDQYGNPIINEPGIKTVNVRVAFNNNTDKNQLLSIGGIIGDAIQFPSTTFSALSFLSGSVGLDNNTSGNYSLNISSYAPTKTGYSFTNQNDISLQKLSYEVIADMGNTGVGEIIETDIKNKIGTNNLKFSPAFYVGSVNNVDNWNIIQGYDSNFTASLLTGTTVALTNPQVRHILDIDTNTLMSYQNPIVIGGGTEVCNGYRKTVTTFNGSYTSTSPSCSRPDSSNILMNSVPFASNMTFSWKPTIIYAAPANSIVKYASEISYTNGSANVAYPSYNRSNSSALTANGTVMALNATNAGSGIINQAVKILGMSNSRNTIDVLNGNNTNAVGSLTRVDIKNTIHKNVEIMTR